MESKLKKWRNNRNFIKLMMHREHYAEAANYLKQQTQFSDPLIKRLGLEAELEGHHGCVNCLQWSANGLHLASGSDDTNVILWDPFRRKQLQVIPTPHVGNIFSVKFLGDSNLIATAAGDCRVIVQNIEKVANKSPQPPPLLDCGCHIGRVKRLAVCPDQPTLFWSSGEDGFVVQYDLREPHDCPTRSSALIDLSFRSEIKCIAVNPTKPHYLALGVNDCFARVYDRRMLKSTSKPPKITGTSDYVQYYAPGHLAKENAGSISIKLAVTYIAFNSAGSEMLVNIGGEQIYLFDVNNSRHINELRIPQQLPQMKPKPYKSCCQKERLNETTNGICRRLYDSTTYDSCPCFYVKRAMKAFQRKWMSDLYGAARDYLHVIQYWPDHKQSYLGLIKCLISLKWDEEADLWLKHFLKLFPEFETSPQVKPFQEEMQALKKCTIVDDDLELKKVEGDEKLCRLESFDFEKRYLGHCNTTTDIKEATFLGDSDQYVCAGSDDGIIFIWDKHNMEIVRAMYGDNSIVNCIQPHPSACVVASSGIESAVKIWSPMPEDGKTNNRVVNNLDTVMETNEYRIRMDPFESMLASMRYQIQSTDGQGQDQEGHFCRTS